MILCYHHPSSCIVYFTYMCQSSNTMVKQGHSSRLEIGVEYRGILCWTISNMVRAYAEKNGLFTWNTNHYASKIWPCRVTPNSNWFDRLVEQPDPHGSESAWQYNVNSITLSSSVVSRSYFQRVSSSFFGFRPPISTLLCFHFAMWSNNSVLYYSRCIGATYMQPRISQSVSKNVCVLVTGTRGCCTMPSAPNQNNPLLWDASPVALCHLYWWCLCFAFIVKDILPLAWSNKNIKMKVYLQLLLGKRRQRQRGFL